MTYDVSKVSPEAQAKVLLGVAMTFQLQLKNKNYSVIVLNPMSMPGTTVETDYSVTKTIYMMIGNKKKAMGSQSLSPTTTVKGQIYEYIAQIESEGYKLQ